MPKGTLPVPHIIAIVIGIIIIAIMGYLFFQQIGSFGGEVSKQNCLKAVTEYCSFYDPTRNWDGKYGSKPTQENCINYQAGKYNPCTAEATKTKETTITVDEIKEVLGGTGGTKSPSSGEKSSSEASKLKVGDKCGIPTNPDLASSGCNPIPNTRCDGSTCKYTKVGGETGCFCIG